MAGDIIFCCAKPVVKQGRKATGLLQGTSQEQFYQDNEGILFLVGLSHEEHSNSMRRLRESN